MQVEHPGAQQAPGHEGTQQAVQRQEVSRNERVEASSLLILHVVGAASRYALSVQAGGRWRCGRGVQVPGACVLAPS